MHDPVDVRPHAVNQQVHANFTGNVATALQLAATHVNDDAGQQAFIPPLDIAVGVTRTWLRFRRTDKLPSQAAM